MSQLGFTLKYQQLQTKIDSLSNEIEALTPKCSLTTVLLDINGSVLKSIECPQLTVSTYKAPGFFSSINKIREFISLHPAQGIFHLQIILNNLSKQEPGAYIIATQGGMPSSVEECFHRVAVNLMQPRNCQRILKGEIQRNRRLIDPTAINDFRTNAENEFKKSIAFHTVLLEV